MVEIDKDISLSDHDQIESWPYQIMIRLDHKFIGSWM